MVRTRAIPQPDAPATGASSGTSLKSPCLLFQPPDVPQNDAHFEVKGQVEDHVPGVDSPSKSDSDEYEAREEELVDVEDMTRHKADETKKKASKQATR